MDYSFFGQLKNPHSDDISGLPNPWVVGVKTTIYLVGLIALVGSVRSATRNR